jgi:hypothetical protein
MRNHKNDSNDNKNIINDDMNYYDFQTISQFCF